MNTLGQIGGMNPKLPELVKEYASVLKEKKLTLEAIEKEKKIFDNLNARLMTLATEIDAAAGRSYGGPNIIETEPGKGILVEHGQGIREVNLAMAR